MRPIGLVILLALVACQSRSLTPPVAGDPSAALRSSEAAPARAVRLPAGTYLATVRPDKNAIRYYSLSGSALHFAGEARIQTGNCAIGWTNDANLDRQHGIDFSVTCPSGLGFMQVPAGEIGTVAPSRTILTHFPNSTLMYDAVDSRGDVAIATPNAFGKPVAHEVLLYGPNAAGDARPSYTVPLRTSGCKPPSGQKGPSNVWGSAWHLSFTGDGTLLVAVGPLVTCGPIYIERFPPDSTRYATWFVAGLSPSNTAHRPPFFIDPDFVLGPRDELVFGAFIGHPSNPNGRNGGVEYAANVTGFEPLPQRTFADSAADFGGSSFKQTTPLGVDDAGNTYLYDVQGKVVRGRVRPFNHLVVFGPHANRTDKPSRVISVDKWGVAFASVIVDVAPAR